MIIPKKSKFTEWEWKILSKHLAGHLGELHHSLGKQYERLAYLEVLSPEKHRGSGHKKHIHGMPEEEAKRNIEYWKQLLKDDFEWFTAENLVCD